MEAANPRKGGGVGGGVVVSLPEDIIFDVLTRLPAKVLCRFRCVCKEWRALISDEAFVAAQRSRAAPLIAGVFRSRCKVQMFELRVMDMDGSVLRVFQGVACFLDPARLDDLICVYRMWDDHAMVIDPASGRLVTTISEQYPCIGKGLSSWRFFSFGRAALSGAYKVLRIHQGHVVQPCEIATINKNGGAELTWRQTAGPPSGTTWPSSCNACVNGTLYFILHGTGKPLDKNSIAAFNLESEEWEETIDGPAMGLKKAGEDWFIYLIVLKGTLSMVQTVWPYGYEEDHYTNIWVLDDSKKSAWAKKYTIPVPKNMIISKALDVLDDGRILLLNGLDKRVKNTILKRYVIQFYDPSTQAFTDFMEMAKEFEAAHNMALYTGSLLS